MELWKAIIVAIVQGLTEWLPVSSSGHLVIVERLLDLDVGLDFDVALHLGTLMAVFVYFGKDIVDTVEALLKGRFKSEEGKLGLYILVATIPAALIGFFFRNVFENTYDSLILLSAGFAVTAVVLFIASINFGKTKGNFKDFGYGKAFIIGLTQVFAILPSVSRSGVTLAGGLLSGLNEKNALKFSFLMSIPVIFGANVLVLGTNKISSDLVLPVFVSFIVGLASIHFLFKILQTNRKNLRWFALYTLILAIVILGWIVFR